MKKIVIITDVWHPQVNGVMTSLEKTIKLLKEKSFSITVIHPGLFHTIPMPFYPEIKLPFFTRNKIKEILRKEKPDHIHIITEGLLGFSARTVCKKNGLKFTTSYHTNFPHYIKIRFGFLFSLSYAYLRWFHKGGESTMVCTNSLREELSQKGFKNLKIWPLGVDIDFFVKNNEATQIEKFKKPIFFYFGRVATEKNVEEFLECTLPGTKLVIGDGPARKKLEKKYKEAVFIGCKKGQELVNIISQCDVMIFPSKTDTFGLVIIETMACGIPVAAHDVIGPKDIISLGVDGYLGDNLSEAAIKCLTLSSEKCREKASHYSWNDSIRAFISNLVQA